MHVVLAKPLHTFTRHALDSFDQTQQPQHIEQSPFAEGDIGRLLGAMEAALEGCLSLQVELAAIDPWRFVGAQECVAPEAALGKSAGCDVDKRRQTQCDHGNALLAKSVDGELGQTYLGMRGG